MTIQDSFKSCDLAMCRHSPGPPTAGGLGRAPPSCWSRGSPPGGPVPQCLSASTHHMLRLHPGGQPPGLLTSLEPLLGLGEDYVLLGRQPGPQLDVQLPGGWRVARASPGQAPEAGARGDICRSRHLVQVQVSFTGVRCRCEYERHKCRYRCGNKRCRCRYSEVRCKCQV